MSRLSRRRFLGQAAGAGALLLGGGCRSRGAVDAGPDLTAASLGVGMESVIVERYRSAATMFREGQVGAAIPPVIAEFVTTATLHHQDHLEAWTAILADAGRPTSPRPNVALVPALEMAAAGLIDIPAIATLALRLEDYASQTYLSLIPTLQGAATTTLAGQMLIVDAQHQAILRYLLGLYPVGSGVAPGAIDLAPAEPRLALISG